MSERRIHEKYRQKAKAFGITNDSCEVQIGRVKGIWLEQYKLLQSSLSDMKVELFDNQTVKRLSVTGQNVLALIAERALRYTHEATEAHRLEIHPKVSNVLKSIDKNIEQSVQQVFKRSKFVEYGPGCEEPFTSMIYDYVTMEGFNSSSCMTREEANLIKPVVQDPETLSLIVTDLRFGDIDSSLNYISTVHPKDEVDLRTNLQAQTVVDCIEKDNYAAAVMKLKKYKDELCGDRRRAPRLIGALLMGKASKKDSRYKEFFKTGQRDVLKTRMASFFIDPRNSPLKEILTSGVQALGFMTETGGGYTNGMYAERELPINIDVSAQAHSAFACPILKEQSTLDNPPIRLICGHVVSRDAITRLTTSLRQMRTSTRHARFKCPYCPKEQYMDNSKRIEFTPWTLLPVKIEEISEDESDEDEEKPEEIVDVTGRYDEDPYGVQEGNGDNEEEEDNIDVSDDYFDDEENDEDEDDEDEDEDEDEDDEPYVH